ncbi:ABC transporter permease [Candidatus Dependentiae bacterium]|nr:ABC transporter permease [Candidatus Dependentiae bacterium]
MKLLRDIWIVFIQNLLIGWRNPLRSLVGLFQPICFLVLFAPLLNTIAEVPGFPPGGALAVFTPGLLIMMALYSSAFVGFTLLADIRLGVIERLQVAPISRSALIVGRALRDSTVLFGQALVLVASAWCIGLKVYIVPVMLGIILALLVGLMVAAFSYGIALRVKDEYSLAPTINFFLIPLQLLSGITLPLTLAPSWIQWVAKANPLSYAVTAARLLFNGVIMHTSVALAFGIIFFLALFFLWWAVRSFKSIMG